MARIWNKHKQTNTPLKRKVFVGLSGGVDSAVSAALLQKAGHEVIGIFIKTWHPEFLECNEEEERRDAMRVAAHLDVPFLTFDLSDVYKKEVADYMVREYKAGRTPNPDVMCNREVKFGVFLKRAIAMGADYVATGHYAQIRNVSAENAFSQALGSLCHSDYTLGVIQPEHSKKHFLPSLTKGRDLSKDQSYFLWTLTQKQLSRILFPVGILNKTKVRALAKKFKLPVAQKKDSQGICFLGAIDLKEFLKHYIKIKKGKVVNEVGESIGFHDGVPFYTLGKRHGFTVTAKTPKDRPYYVVGKNVSKNTLIVSQDKNIFQHNHSNIWTDIGIKDTNWISGIPRFDKSYTAQILYHGEFLPCRVKIFPHNRARVLLQSTASGSLAKALAAAGQSCVIYDKEVCLGGGIIV